MAGGGIKINNIKISGGADGATFTPSVDTAGNLSWTNDKGYENPTTVNIKGEKGEQGEQGRQGLRGIRGVQGEAGKDGKDGTIITANGEEQSIWNADTKADVEEVERVREETNMLWDEVFIIYDDLNHASTRISNVEQDTKLVKEALFNKGIIARAEIEQAYTSRVTANGENIVDGQKTPVTLIKGSTKRCENLLVYPYPTTSNTTNNGITWTFDEQGVITVNGTSTAISAYYLMNSKTGLNKAGTYTISMVNGSTSYYLEIESRDIATGKWLWGKPVRVGNYTFTLNEGEYFVVQIRVDSGVTANNQKIYVMLNEGSTALPWQPYFTDLKHAYIDKIVSTGHNLFDISKLVGGALVDNGDGTYTMTKNGNNRWSRVWTLDAPILLETVFSNLELVEKTTTVDKLAIIATLTNGVQRFFGLATNGSGRYGISGEVKSFQFYLNSTEPDGAYFKFKNPFITRQVEGNNYYTPFIQEAYQLPETLELGEWDSFNPQTGEITRGTGRIVFDGTENWYGSSTGNGSTLRRVACSLTSILAKQSQITDVNGICNSYKSISEQDTYFRTQGVSVTGSATETKIFVYDEMYATNDVSLWKEHLAEMFANGTPLTVEFELATPTVEKLENAPKPYTAYNQGNEAVVNENGEFGAIPTITNEYIVVL